MRPDFFAGKRAGFAGLRAAGAALQPVMVALDPALRAADVDMRVPSDVVAATACSLAAMLVTTALSPPLSLDRDAIHSMVDFYLRAQRDGAICATDSPFEPRF